jgi:hypothetical protein
VSRRSWLAHPHSGTESCADGATGNRPDYRCGDSGNHDTCRSTRCGADCGASHTGGRSPDYRDRDHSAESRTRDPTDGSTDEPADHGSSQRNGHTCDDGTGSAAKTCTGQSCTADAVGTPGGNTD